MCENKPKRLVSEVSPKVFTDIKVFCASRDINQKDLISLSVAKSVGIPYAQVCDKPETIVAFKKIVGEE